jgi:hypothetical protein
MKKVDIPIKLKDHFERKLKEALAMINHYYLNSVRRNEWERCAEYWKKKLNKLNNQ